MKHYWSTLPGGFWFKLAYTRLLDWFPKDKPSLFVEVGSCEGQSIAYLAVEVINRQLPVTIVCVDNFTWSPHCMSGIRERFEKNTSPLKAILNGRFRLEPVSSVRASELFKDGEIDAVWLDAGHSYPEVRDDIQAWWPKIRNGGILGGDDFDMAGVTLAVRESGPYELINGWRDDRGFQGPWRSWWREKHEKAD